jgi:acetyl esterase/lipase
VIHRGSTIAPAEGKVIAVSTGKLLAHGTTTCLISPAVEVHRYGGQLHGFISFPGKLDAGRDAVDRSAAALRIAFSS